MRYVLMAVTALVLLVNTAFAQSNAPIDAASIVKKVRRSVIRVEGIPIEWGVASGSYGGGSGFLFEINYDDGTGYALTNHHVFGSGVVGVVTFWDDAQFKCDLVASEPGIDVALIRVYGLPDERDLPDEEKNYVPCVLGDSDQVMMGEWAMAMGNPGANEAFMVDRSNPFEDFMLKQTSTVRQVIGRETLLDFSVSIWNQQKHGDLGWQYGTNLEYVFRCSAAINPGNSGGPLFNTAGEVIAINFYGGQFSLAQNHNWSIPINAAKDFAYQILETGKFEKPWLGVDIIMPPYYSTAEDYVEFVERHRPPYIEIFEIRKDSPADRAGLLKADIIRRVDGQTFDTPEDLRVYVFDQEIGTYVSLEVERDGRMLKEPILVEVGAKRFYNSEFSV